MARALPGLAKAVTEILESRGVDGKRLSFRQAERLTGLAPATISELAKGNARTPETVRRFANGAGEDVTRLLLLAGFIPDDQNPTAEAKSERPQSSTGIESPDSMSMSAEIQESLSRLGRALTQLPPCRDRHLWIENIRRDTELIEALVARIGKE